jgi:hypothetical protein
MKKFKVVVKEKKQTMEKRFRQRCFQEMMSDLGIESTRYRDETPLYPSWATDIVNDLLDAGWIKK